MDRSSFVYVIYIASTPDMVWKALLDGEFTRQYWGHENVSDWQPDRSGSIAIRAPEEERRIGRRDGAFDDHA